MSTSQKNYHHGDLRSALLAAAIESLEAGEPFSLRAAARKAGVSPTAPYRHFADRKALDSAVAIEGFKDLRADLTAALAGQAEPRAPEEVFTALGVAYVAFALRRPAVFRLMFGNECDDADSERVQAAGDLHQVLTRAIEGLFPGANLPGLSTALWSMAHGLAFLHLDGKFRPDPNDEVAARVQSVAAAVFAVGRQTSHPSGGRTPQARSETKEN